jgi:hypothetical protein
MGRGLTRANRTLLVGASNIAERTCRRFGKSNDMASSAGPKVAEKRCGEELHGKRLTCYEVAAAALRHFVGEPMVRLMEGSP